MKKKINDKQIKDIAINKAKQSSCRYKISAIGLNKQGNVIGSSCNKERFKFKGGGIHAEVALLKKYGKKVKSIIICRINKQGKIKDIEPCKNCKRILDNLKIKVYSIRELK